MSRRGRTTPVLVRRRRCRRELHDSGLTHLTAVSGCKVLNRARGERTGSLVSAGRGARLLSARTRSGPPGAFQVVASGVPVRRSSEDHVLMRMWMPQPA